jgi:hypothetical protein
MTISEWLKSIGMEQYISVFESNNLSFDNLDHVTEADLASMGVSLGHRKSILKEIQMLKNQAALAEAGDQSRSAKKRVRAFTTTMLVLFVLGGGLIGYAAREPDETMDIAVILGLLGGMMVWLFGYIYMLPTILAFKRQNKFRWAIGIGNVFAGVTVIGWVILLCLGLKKIDGGQAVALAVLTDSTS